MPSEPPWLRLARSLIGRADVDRTAIAAGIARIWPDMADYCRYVAHDVSVSDRWCGLFLAHCVTQIGYCPPFKPTSLAQGFLRPFAWSVWGKPSWRLPGDIVVLDLGGWHHAAFYVSDNGDGTWSCLGASQGRDYTTGIVSYKGDYCVAVRRPEAI
jgi:hypothetical protein